MNQFYNYKRGTVYSSFAIAIILQIMPFFPEIWYFQPSWIMILLVYWIAILPSKINIGTSFTLGLVTDMVLGSTFGVHSLSLSVLTYLIVRKIYFFRYIPIWQQSFVIVFFSFINQSIIFTIKFIVTAVSCAPEIFWNCLFDGGSWPFVAFIMRKIRRY